MNTRMVVTSSFLWLYLLISHHFSWCELLYRWWIFRISLKYVVACVCVGIGTDSWSHIICLIRSDCFAVIVYSWNYRNGETHSLEIKVSCNNKCISCVSLTRVVINHFQLNVLMWYLQWMQCVGLSSCPKSTVKGRVLSSA